MTIENNKKYKLTGEQIKDLASRFGVLSGEIGDLANLTTTDKSNLVAAINEAAAGGGSGPTVVQTTGTSTTDVMSQNATTSMVFADPGTNSKIKIGSGGTSFGSESISIGDLFYNTEVGDETVVIGHSASGYRNENVIIGHSASSNNDNTVVIGHSASTQTTSASYSVAIGAGARATMKGQFDISTGLNLRTSGYNNSNYRLLTGLYDGQTAHDAATYGQVISYSAINGAGAPTTATEGKYVGQLYYDTTNEAMYFLKTIDTTTTPATYTWEALGGGSSVNVVQTIGTSTTDVMSQKAVTDVIFGKYAMSDGASNQLDIGFRNTNNYSVPGTYVALGRIDTGWRVGDHAVIVSSEGAYASAAGSVAVGAGAIATSQGEMNIGSRYTQYGYNNSNYRLLTGLYDPQSAHDAATKGYVDGLVGNVALALNAINNGGGN